LVIDESNSRAQSPFFIAHVGGVNGAVSRFIAVKALCIGEAERLEANVANQVNTARSRQHCERSDAVLSTSPTYPASGFDALRSGLPCWRLTSTAASCNLEFEGLIMPIVFRTLRDETRIGPDSHVVRAGLPRGPIGVLSHEAEDIESLAPTHGVSTSRVAIHLRRTAIWRSMSVGRRTHSAFRSTDWAASLLMAEK
jgi:hypothetical protein